MLLVLLVLLPVAAGILALITRNRRARRIILPLAGVSHSAMTAYCWARLPEQEMGGLLGLDSLGLLFLSVTSALFLCASFYSVGYLAREQSGDREDFEQGYLFSNAPEAVFVACMLFFLAAMTLVCVSQHLGILWVGIEATTVTSAPLIYFHRHRRSLEATWKYLMICSVGIALALMGYLLLAVSATGASGGTVTMTVDGLLESAAVLHTPWLKAAVIFFIVGYGTKVGLAPLHTWLPDAHSEAPSVVSALLSGAVLNCAFLGIMRVVQVSQAAGLRDFTGGMLTALGLLSLGVAAVFILRQPDYKRMLAYSSVEHMGIVALGVGLGGGAAFGGVFHALNHSLTKGMLFLVAGNILAFYRTKKSDEVRGVMRALPISGMLWVAGFLAITGSPPFGTFMSEFAVLKYALDSGHYLAAAVYLVLLAIIFVGMAGVVLKMALGPLPETSAKAAAEPIGSVLPAAALGLAVMLFGVYLPSPLQALLHDAAGLIGGF
jgi:hydrogenase-4 component F